MAPITPYTSDLDNREPVSAMRDTAARIRAVVGDWRPDQFNRSYAPGKWDARQILTHLAQSEIALGYRDPNSIRVEEFANREDEGVLLVPKAGEMLFQLEHPPKWAGGNGE
jgi:hypothetical protein